jgi:hypothetical protein
MLKLRLMALILVHLASIIKKWGRFSDFVWEKVGVALLYCYFTKKKASNALTLHSMLFNFNPQPSMGVQI